GLALGGGLELGMACMMRVAASTARLGLPEIKHSLMPAYGGTQLLPRLVGYARAAQMMLSGEMIEAARAEQIGLVNAVADDVLAAAVAMAQDCSRGSSTASREIRRALGEGWSLPLAQGLAIEAACAGRVAASEEARAGVAAFGAKH
ncbi:MAG TPA: enoyl-CoA hydratase-related protein, partial [Novosphingobium sp.]